MKPRFLIGLLLLGIGCIAANRPVRTDIILPIACLQAPIVLQGCIDGDVTRCEHSQITYKPGCEIVMAPKVK